MIGLISVCMLTVSGRASGMDAGLQLQVPACRLLEQSCSSESKDRINSKHLLKKTNQHCGLTHFVGSVYWYQTFPPLSASIHGSHTHTSTFVHDFSVLFNDDVNC